MDSSNNLHPGMVLDEVDTEIITQMQKNGRITNQKLAERVGIAPSTCVSRVRNLIQNNVITGFTARVDPRALGLELQVVVSVMRRAGARANLAGFLAELRQQPEVAQVFFLGGVEDFLIHLMARDAEHVREFVTEYLSEHPGVSSTKTSIVFSHVQSPVIGEVR